MVRFPGLITAFLVEMLTGSNGAETASSHPAPCTVRAYVLVAICKVVALTVLVESQYAQPRARRVGTGKRRNMERTPPGGRLIKDG